MTTLLAPPAQTSTPLAEELDRLEILRAYKQLLAGNGSANRSPFADHRVVRYDTAIEAWDIPEIHDGVRQAIRQNLQELRAGQSSRVVVFAGDPGMGKSHLLNYFRTARVQEELGYLLVGNSNHWKVDEFEACLLTWLVAALTRPSIHGPNLLAERIEDVAFGALDQILDQPGKIREFLGGTGGWLRRLWWKFGPDQHARFRQAIAARDASVFRRLNFARFSEFVCERFLNDRTNPFHRFVLQVLLRFLFPEDRPLVLAWLVGQTVQCRFLEAVGKPPGAEPVDPDWPEPEQVQEKLLDRLGVADRLDWNYKFIDTIKILVSLFSPELDKSAPAGQRRGGRVIFFAFDQIEGRKELFDSEADWFKFFAKLSELYNALPNIFIVFTMTLHLRNYLYPKMEAQFQQRIQRDQKFVLARIEDKEILAVYRRHLEVWRTGRLPLQEHLFANPRLHFLPFTPDDILASARNKTLRAMLEDLDREFREYMLEKVGAKEARQDYLVAVNEWRAREKQVGNAFTFTDSHLDLVHKLLTGAAGLVTDHWGLVLQGMQTCATEDGHAALRFELRKTTGDDRPVRIFLARLAYVYKAKAESYRNLLHYQSTTRAFLWLVRPDRIDDDVENLKPGQVVTRVLPSETQCQFEALLHLLERVETLPPTLGLSDDDREKYRHDARHILQEEIKTSYLGELFQQALDVLEHQHEGNDDGDN